MGAAIGGGQGRAHRQRRRTAARRPWLRQGASGRTLVSRSACGRPCRRRTPGLVMIYLETPKKFRGLIDQAQHVAQEIFRPNSRRYDLAEHAYPKELDMLGALLDGLNASGAEGAGAVGGRRSEEHTSELQSLMRISYA